MTLEKISPSRWVLRVENKEIEVDQSTVEKIHVDDAMNYLRLGFKNEK